MPSCALRGGQRHGSEAMLKKKLTAQAKKTACQGLQEWVQPVVNHLYWCVAVSRGDGKLLVAIWKSMLNHVINVHHGDGEPYPRCLHDDLPNGKWLLPGREQATTESGALRWKRKIVRAKKGEEVVSPGKTKPTYAYVGKLLEQMMDVCQSSPSLRASGRGRQRKGTNF
ncbi:hypothetical protein MTO96_038417 [Rhipicephalus appendiculatus]